jgi:WD40 repeat protein
MVLGRDAEWDACRSVLEGHTQSVWAVVFSADGQLLASASRDNTVRVWETATGACRSVLEGHTNGVNAVVFSADGQLLASASYDNTVRVWETATGACRTLLESNADYVNAVVFSADGLLLALASRDRTVRVWETATGACRTVLESQSPYIYYLTFSLNGRVLRTEKGDIPLPLDLYSTSSLIEEEQSSQLVAEGQWVFHSTQRLVWLPFEYRADNTAVHKDVVCVGCPSGRVALLKLQQRHAQEQYKKTEGA